MTETHKKILSEFSGYAVVGLIATIVDVSTLYVVTEYMGIYYLISNVIAFSLGLTTNYLLCTNYVFKTRSLDNRLHELLIFIGIGILGLGLNTFILWTGTSLLGIYYIVSKAIAVAFVFLFNFLLRKFILFN